MWRFPRDSWRTGTPQDFFRRCCFRRKIHLREECVAAHDRVWDSWRFSDLSLSLKHTRCPNSFCLFVLGVTLKPWCRATHRFSFKWQSDIPILTVSPSSFSLFSLSVALFLSFHSPPNTPTYTNTHKHTRTHTNTHTDKWELASLELAKHHSSSANHTQAALSVNSTVPVVWPNSHLHRHLLSPAASCKINALPSIPRAEARQGVMVSSPISSLSPQDFLWVAGAYQLQFSSVTVSYCMCLTVLVSYMNLSLIT